MANTINDAQLNNIATILRKQKVSDAEIASIVEEIKQDVPKRYIETPGFGASVEANAKKVKDFGLTNILGTPEQLEILVADTSTIEYSNDNGEPELFAFDAFTLRKLGEKLEGVPVVIGKGHDADLPIAYFTKEANIKAFESDGKELKGLFVKANVRNDKDAPITKELFKDGRWTMNGGEHKLSGSLRFSSTDVPYFYDDGSKINYMTKIVPRHYALVDTPFVRESGVVNKNFGDNSKGDIVMAEPVVPAPVTPEAKVAPPAPVAPAPVAVVTPPAPVVAPVAAEVKADPAPEVEMVPKSELVKLMEKLAEMEKRLNASERSRLVEKITVQKFGTSADKAMVDKFVDTELKNFGLPELNGYLAGLGEAKAPAAPAKNFGKGAVDTTKATPDGVKLKLFYMKDDKK